MENVDKFLEQVRLKKQADTLLQASYNTNEAEVVHLLNQQGDRYAYGKAAEYKRLLKTCKFKLVAYFDKDKWGRQYTTAEKKAKLNRRYIPSIDRVGRVHNEQLGHDTLIDYCLQKTSRLDSAQIILMDRVNGLEHRVFAFDPTNVAASTFTELQFKTDTFGNTYFVQMVDEPLRTDKIKFV